MNHQLYLEKTIHKHFVAEITHFTLKNTVCRRILEIPSEDLCHWKQKSLPPIPCWGQSGITAKQILWLCQWKHTPAMQLNYGSLTIWIWEFGISLLHMILRLLFFFLSPLFFGFLLYIDICWNCWNFVYCPNHWQAKTSVGWGFSPGIKRVSDRVYSYMPVGSYFEI